MLDRVIDYVGTMGAADVCSSGPLAWDARGYDDYRSTCDFLNEKGQILSQAGIALHYHNHEFEFLPVRNHTRAMEVLLKHLDFSVVDLCLDAGWVWRAGVDPAAFMTTHAQRIGTVHLRDFSGSTSVALGAGDMDLAPVISALDRIPALRWVVVEHDPVSAKPIPDLAASRAFLKDHFSL